MNVKAWEARIPELKGERFTTTPLRGGLTNQSYLLSGDFGRWVLRLNRDIPGVDRERERIVLHTISHEPWAPVVVRNAPEDGYLLYEFKDVPVWSGDHARSVEGQRVIGRWLRAVHAKPAAQLPPVDVVGALDTYLQELPESVAQEISQRSESILEAWAIDAPFWTQSLCHLDLVANNVLGNGKLSGVIDWEFAGRAEPALDLAFFLHYHDLDELTGTPLLDSYGAGRALRNRVEQGLGVVAVLDQAWRSLPHHAER